LLAWLFSYDPMVFTLPVKLALCLPALLPTPGWPAAISGLPWRYAGR
jgi:hypothetical protein